MRLSILILYVFSSILAKATEQAPDLLIYKSDTIYIDNYPLEILSHQDSIIANRLKDSTCLSTDCWRQYIGIWKIENDSLFLIGLKDCCDYEDIPINKVFNTSKISNERVFAEWYSANIIAGFGQLLKFDEDNWENVYEKNLMLEIVNGRIKKVEIKKNETLEDIEEIAHRKKHETPTMANKA